MKKEIPIEPVWQLVNQLHNVMNEAIADNKADPETLRFVKELHSKLLDMEIELSARETYDMLDAMERFNGANYDECKGY